MKSLRDLTTFVSVRAMDIASCFVESSFPSLVLYRASEALMSDSTSSSLYTGDTLAPTSSIILVTCCCSAMRRLGALERFIMVGKFE
jgi:hypothetical protein